MKNIQEIIRTTMREQRAAQEEIKTPISAVNKQLGKVTRVAVMLSNIRHHDTQLKKRNNR